MLEISGQQFKFKRTSRGIEGGDHCAWESSSKISTSWLRRSSETFTLPCMS